jgi:hypothetical protein
MDLAFLETIVEIKKRFRLVLLNPKIFKKLIILARFAKHEF